MLATERLVFRPYTAEDLDFLMSMTGDPEVMRYIGQGNVWTREQTAERLRMWMNRYEEEQGLGLMVVARKSDGELIGYAGLVPQLVDERKETEVGYWISRRHWGQGYASEAALALRNFGLSHLGKKRLISLIQFDNHSSVKVARKIGMNFEREIVFNGKSIALYSLTRQG
ncbi:GNAT family N-acetyltransferase [Brevibacillus sp. FSL L8-0520]|uniref:GNAT family N-acetyltransferase n=1 Tax=Brevibacillus TaxID=55080 RepID=UPI0030D2EE1E